MVRAAISLYDVHWHLEQLRWDAGGDYLALLSLSNLDYAIHANLQKLPCWCQMLAPACQPTYLQCSAKLRLCFILSGPPPCSVLSSSYRQLPGLLASCPPAHQTRSVRRMVFDMLYKAARQVCGGLSSYVVMYAVDCESSSCCLALDDS
jgi:hypothetical protein